MGLDDLWRPIRCRRADEDGVADGRVAIDEVEDTLYVNLMSGSMTLHMPAKTRVSGGGIGRLAGFFCPCVCRVCVCLRLVILYLYSLFFLYKIFQILSGIFLVLT